MVPACLCTFLPILLLVVDAPPYCQPVNVRGLLSVNDKLLVRVALQMYMYIYIHVNIELGPAEKRIPFFGI